MSHQNPSGSLRRAALPDSARLGTIELGCFRLKELLGRGSYGTVFLADQEGFDREAVVKIAHARLLVGRDAGQVRARFAAELRAATRVNHPNVVTLFTAGETSDGLPAIAMEYVPGTTLEALLDQRAGALPPAFLHDVFGQLGRAVAAFHRASVTHRDLSPTNVIVGDDEHGDLVVKVLDFGAAAMGDGRTSIVGTPRYMAPEQVVGASSTSSDVYALGAMLWWALTGQEFHSNVVTLEDVTEARLMGSVRVDIREVVPDVSQGVAELVGDMLVFETGNRPSAPEFCERWEALASELDTSSGPAQGRSVTLPPHAAPARRTARPRMLACVVFEPDHVRAGLLSGFLQRCNCHVEAASVAESIAALANRPDVVFVSAHLPGGACEPIIRRAKADYPGALVVALIATERERSTLIRAGADVALRLPGDLPHLSEHLEEARLGGGAHASGTLPTTAGGELSSPAPGPDAAVIEIFVGEAPELLADISDALDRRDAALALVACDKLRSRALALGGTQLARLSNACAAFADDGDFRTAAGFKDELDAEYGVVFQRLMNLHAQSKPELQR